MKAMPLETSNSDISLIQPEIERDAPLSVNWLEGDLGRSTLKLMGVVENDIKPPTLEHERERVKDFIQQSDQLNWMIQYKDKVVGSIWVDLIPKETVQAPSIHIMIGDSEVRGKGIGSTSSQAVIKYLREEGFSKVYSRHLVSNKGATKLLEELGFRDTGEPYNDTDELTWQNVSLQLK